MEYGLVAVWLLGLVALAALAAPLATRLFGRWPTAGVGFTLPVALVTLGVTAFWVGRLAYGTPTLLAGLAVLAALAVAVGLDREAVRAALDGGELSAGRVVTAVVAGLRVDHERVRRRAVVETGAVFLVAFGFLVAVRAVDPAIVPRSGEKFLDFGLLQSLARAETLPPEDMWFAGEPVSYYYGGHLLSDLLARLTGTPRRFAYNLALATFFATYVTAAFDLAGSVAAARGYSRRLAAWGAAFAVGLAGNVQTGGRLLLQALPDGLQSWAVAQIQPHVGLNVTEWLSDGYWFPGRAMWASSRVIPGTINEFPLFAFLNGDLHAHMVGPTFLLLAAALAFVLYDAPTTGRRRAVLFGLVPVVGALQAVVHTWAFPTVFGLAWLALSLSPTAPWGLLPRVARGPVARFVGRPATDGGVTTAERERGRLGAELARPVVAAALVAVAGAFAAVLAAPFLVGTATSGSSREIAVLAAADRSSWGGLAIVHGAFLLVFGSYLTDRVGGRRPWEFLAAVGVLWVVAAQLSFPAVGLVGPVLLGGWIAARTDRAGFETVLLVGGAGLALIVELVYVSEQAGPGRLNTVFKTYSQVWAIWAVAAGVAVAGLWRRVETPALAAWPTPRARHAAVVAVLAVAVCGAGGYAVVTVPNQFGAGDGGSPTSAYDYDYPQASTLDATAHVEQFHPGIAAGVDYLDDKPGQPVLLSAPGAGWSPGKGFGNPPGMYSWGSSPAASLTGLPTVAGWGHEVGYRGREAFYGRVGVVDRAYTDRTATVAVLREHDVSYVWVGQAERNRYGASRVEFDRIAGVEPVVDKNGVVVYRVEQSELPQEE